ncbi:hypothetical protein D9M68_598080 [compost metagenome]
MLEPISSATFKNELRKSEPIRFLRIYFGVSPFFMELIVTYDRKKFIICECMNRRYPGRSSGTKKPITEALFFIMASISSSMSSPRATSATHPRELASTDSLWESAISLAISHIKFHTNFFRPSIESAASAGLPNFSDSRVIMLCISIVAI